MKVLFIITQSEIGGAQRYLLEFTKYLAGKGHAIAIAAGEGDGGLFEELSILNPQFPITEHRIPNLVRNLNPIKDILALFSILKLIKKENPDVIFLQSTKAGFLGSLAAKLLTLNVKSKKLRIVYRIGGWSFRDPRASWMNAILFWMEKISSGWKDIIIVNSGYDRQLAVDKNIAPTAKLTTIYNGINPVNIDFFSKNEARKKLSIINGQLSINSQFSNDQTKVIGTISNLYATKGTEYLLEAARILTLNSKPGPPTPIFIVIGEGKERKKLESLIRKHHLENKFFIVGRVLNASRYLKAFDVFVLPSVKEGMPWVLLEAMAAEIPIIATRVGAIPEVIENKKEGLLVPPKNTSILTEKISYLLHNSDDRRSYVKNAKRKLQQFSSKKMLEESKRIISQY